MEIVAEGDNGQRANRAVSVAATGRDDARHASADHERAVSHRVHHGSLPDADLDRVGLDHRGDLFKTYDALAAGAVDVLEKPRGDASDVDWNQRLLAAVRLVARIKVITHPRARLGLARGPATLQPALREPVSSPSTAPLSLIALGASTGGPSALVSVLRDSAAQRGLLVLVVLHIDEPFGSAFAEWLSEQTPHAVKFARGGEQLDSELSRVLMAPPGRHLIAEGARLALTDGPERHSCRPSIDTLFESLARSAASRSAAALLTGMGRDGALGLLALREAGGFTIAQDEESSIVFGMPREAALLGVPPVACYRSPISAVAWLTPSGVAQGPDDGQDLDRDDSLTVRMDLAEAFEAAGLETVLAATAAETRLVLGREAVALVILDVVLPDADGLELLKEIKSSASVAPPAVLLLSTEAEVADRIRGLQTGADDYVGKPYDTGYVIARARALLAQRNSQRTANSAHDLDCRRQPHLSRRVEARAGSRSLHRDYGPTPARRA